MFLLFHAFLLVSGIENILSKPSGLLKEGALFVDCSQILMINVVNLHISTDIFKHSIKRVHKEQHKEIVK